MTHDDIERNVPPSEDGSRAPGRDRAAISILVRPRGPTGCRYVPDPGRGNRRNLALAHFWLHSYSWWSAQLIAAVEKIDISHEDDSREMMESIHCGDVAIVPMPRNLR